MIVIVCLAIGVGLRLVCGHGLRTLESVRLRGESWLIALLVVQSTVPVLHLTGSGARVAFFIWLATFPLMIGVAWVNRGSAGMTLLAAGLLLNLAVIVANGGMPVFAEAVSAIRATSQGVRIPPTDFVHVAGTASTRLRWLADAIPLPGPTWLRAVASPGDLLLSAGIVSYLGRAASCTPFPLGRVNKQEFA